MKTKVYIAGSCRSRVAIGFLMSKIEDWGYEIAFDWTVHMEDGDASEYVQEDIKRLRECDLLVYCMDGIKSRGKYFELGYAFALNKPIGIYLLPTYYRVINPNDETLPFNVMMENESVFIRSKMCPILHSDNELKTWLANAKFGQ